MAFYDARCEKCNARISWTGKLINRPPCRKCGHKLSDEELKAGEKQIENMMLAAFGEELDKESEDLT